LTKSLVKIGVASANAITGAAMPTAPRSVKPILTFAQATARATWTVMEGTARLRTPANLLVAILSLRFGFGLVNQSDPILQIVGLPVTAAAAVFLIASVLTISRGWRRIIAVPGFLFVGSLLFAAYIAPIRKPLFTWLGSLMASWARGESALLWLVVAAAIVLPLTPLPTRRRFRRRR
jgi:hypothetical protein